MQSNSSPFHFSSGLKLVRDYSIPYSAVDVSIKGCFQGLFPRTGYLVMNLFTGKNHKCQFKNYNHSESFVNGLYITGLFSEGSLILAQQGEGKGYSIKIHPVAGYYFLKTPMNQLADRMVRISSILDKKGLPLRLVESNEKINSLDHNFLTQFFWQMLPEKKVYLNDPIYHAVNKIIGQRGLLNVKTLAKEFCVSERTLNRQFLLKVGLSPQAYAKIWQMDYAMMLLKSNPQVSLPNIAYKAGYYDVAHLSRDFRNRVMLPPSKFGSEISSITHDYLNFPASLK